MSKGIMGPSIVTCCLLCTALFHLYSSWGGSKYNDANLSVSELLAKNNFEALSFDEGSNNTWDEIVNAYKGAEIKAEEKFSSVTATDNQEIREQLKAACKEVVEKPTKSLGTYNKTIRWCVFPQTTAQRLASKGKVALNFNDEGHKAMAVLIAKQYKEGKVKVEGFDFEKTEGDKALEDMMQKACNPLSKVKNWDKNYETKANRMEVLCATNKE